MPYQRHLSAASYTSVCVQRPYYCSLRIDAIAKINGDRAEHRCQDSASYCWMSACMENPSFGNEYGVFGEMLAIHAEDDASIMDQ
jgi:hypothetical protein